MSQQPTILTQPELTQRSSKPVVLIQSEEILRVKTPAYSMNKSDLSFLIRQPSSSAICVNDVQLVVECKFKLDSAAFYKPYTLNGDDANAPYDNYEVQNTAGNNAGDYGYTSQMLPWQNKCIRNAVITINGSSMSHRSNEYGLEYCLLHGNRDYMNKIGGGINDFNVPRVLAVGNRHRTSTCETPTRAMQHKAFLNKMLQDKGVDGVAVAANNDLPVMQWSEKLYLGPFGAFQQADMYPSWSVESQKSPGLLHVHNMQLSLALEDKWWNNMFLQSCTYDAAINQMARIVDVEITKAEIHTRWVLPPPRMISAALTQQVAYSTFDVLRFEAKPQPNVALIQDSSDDFSFTLDAVSFPYQPSLYVFSIAPHYGFKSAQIGNKSGASQIIDAINADKRLTITHLDLQVNTSSAAIPFVGGSDSLTARINARDLYRMTLENSASFEKFPHNFDEWYHNCCVVAITPGQLSGVLNSPNIQGGVTIQGRVFCKNFSGHPVNVSQGVVNQGTLADSGGNRLFEQDVAPRYRCIISGFYSNRSLVLDSKSGLLTESTFSAAFQNSLRMGSA